MTDWVSSEVRLGTPVNFCHLGVIVTSVFLLCHFSFLKIYTIALSNNATAVFFAQLSSRD